MIYHIIIVVSFCNYLLSLHELSIHHHFPPLYRLLRQCPTPVRGKFALCTYLLPWRKCCLVFSSCRIMAFFDTQGLQDLSRITMTDIHQICKASTKASTSKLDKGLKLYALHIYTDMKSIFFQTLWFTLAQGLLINNHSL